MGSLQELLYLATHIQENRDHKCPGPNTSKWTPPHNSGATTATDLEPPHSSALTFPSLSADFTPRKSHSRHEIDNRQLCLGMPHMKLLSYPRLRWALEMKTWFPGVFVGVGGGVRGAAWAMSCVLLQHPSPKLWMVYTREGLLCILGLCEGDSCHSGSQEERSGVMTTCCLLKSLDSHLTVF